jgi:hypothetical protein
LVLRSGVSLAGDDGGEPAVIAVIHQGIVGKAAGQHLRILRFRRRQVGADGTGQFQRLRIIRVMSMLARPTGTSLAT